MPIDVSVVLVGLNGDGHGDIRVDSGELGDLLQAYLPTRVPAVLTDGPDGVDEEASVEYILSYSVSHAEVSDVRAVEAAIASSARRAAPGTTALDSPLDCLDIDAARLEDTLGDIVEHATGGRSATVVVMAPSKGRVRAALAPGLLVHESQTGEADFRYRYHYGSIIDGVAPKGYSQAFIGAGRFLVVDLVAGPTQYGRAAAGEGTVSELSLPRITEMNERDLRLFTTELASSVMSSVQTVVASDIMRTDTHGVLRNDAKSGAAVGQAPPERVVIAVISLRDHDDFDPLQNGHESSLDLNAVRRFAASALSNPSQNVQVVSGSHHLEDHPHLALALARSRRTDSVFAPSSDGNYRAVHRSCIQAHKLMSELETTSDELTSFIHDQGTVAQWSSEASSAFVVPVFVLSLRRWGLDEEETLGDDAEASGGEPLMFDHKSLVATAPNMVLALQPGDGGAQLPFVADGTHVETQTSDVTRDVIAGLASTIGSVSPPFERWSHAHGRRVTDYLWAGPGAHPFGPFTQSTQISALYGDVVQRNAAVARLDLSIRMARAAVAEVNAFADEHAFEPVLVDASPAALSAGLEQPAVAQRAWIDRLFHESDIATVLNRSAVTAMHDGIVELGNAFVAVAADVEAGDLSAAGTRATAAMDRTVKFRAMVRAETDAAKERMACCLPAHKAQRQGRTVTLWLGVGALSVSMIGLAAVIARSGAFRRKHSHWE